MEGWSFCLTPDSLKTQSSRRMFGMGDDTASRSGLGAILCVFAPLREAKTNVEDVGFASRPIRSRRRDAKDVWDGRRHSVALRIGVHPLRFGGLA